MFRFFISGSISTTVIVGRLAVPTLFFKVSNVKTFLSALALLSKDGVALAKTTGILLYFPRYIAISLALYLGLLSCL